MSAFAALRRDRVARTAMSRPKKPKDETPRQSTLEELEQIRHELEQLEYQHETTPFMGDTLEWLNLMDDPDQDHDQSGPCHHTLSPGL